MNGEFLRGEVYWICLDDSVGGEERTGRPAVIVSSNGLNRANETVTVAYMSSVGFATASRPSIIDPQKKRVRVLCDQLRTIDKSRLNKYMYTITEDETIRVEGALACTLGLPAPKMLRKDAPAAEQKQENPENSDVAAMKLEIDMWRRMYEKTMDQLVELRVAQIVARRIERAAEPVLEPVLPEEPEVPESEEEVPEKTPVRHGLVEPDTGVEEDGEPREPKKPKAVWDGVKVNINTVVSARELERRTGMSQKAALEIVRVRKEMGDYEKIDDLLALDHFGKTAMKRYGHMLTVADEEPTEGAPATEKKKPVRVNVNSANAYKLMEAGFSKTVANRIVHHQKNCAPFRNVEELLEIDGITSGNLRKIRENLEV